LRQLAVSASRTLPVASGSRDRHSRHGRLVEIFGEKLAAQRMRRCIVA
jgi:hypothetical protein